MTSALRTYLVPLFSALMFASPAAAGRHPRNVAAQRPNDSGECLRLASRDEVLAGALRSGLFGPGSKDRELGSVRLSGADSFSDDILWDLVGGPPSLPLSWEEAIALVARLAQTGLFSAVEPRIRTLPGEVAALDIALTENPQIRSVQVRGLSEFRTEDILDRLLEVPSISEIETRRREVRDARTRECPAPLPPRVWLARVEDGEVRSGVLWQGLRPSLGRVLRYLRTRGYPLARLEGELTASGKLLVDVDEGRVRGIEARGVDAHIAREVEMELGIRPGDIFSSGELYSGLDRVQRRWPFLRPDRRNRRSPPAPVLRLEGRPDTGVDFRSELPFDIKPLPSGDDDEEEDEEPRPRRRSWDSDDPFGDFDDFAISPEKRHHRKTRKLVARDAWYGLEGDTLVVYLRSERSRAKGQWVELVRHTPVTGFAPGLATTLTIYDPGDRAHLMLDGAVNLNTRRHGHDATGRTF